MKTTKIVLEIPDGDFCLAGGSCPFMCFDKQVRNNQMYHCDLWGVKLRRKTGNYKKCASCIGLAEYSKKLLTKRRQE